MDILCYNRFLITEVTKVEKLEKTCKVHGVLNEADIIKEFASGYKVGFYLRCKKCKNERTWKDGVVCKTHGKLGPDDIKSNGRCKKCHRDSANRKRDENREWFNAKMAQDRIDNPEKWKKRYEKEYQQSLQRHKIRGEDRGRIEVFRLYKITQDIYDNMYKSQNGLCKICNKPETRQRNGKVMNLVVDHCHNSNSVRGLLCHKCNCLIGYANDDKDILEMAIIYLQES